MKKNVGTVDMVIRLLIGIAIIAWGLYAGSWFGVIGLLPIATGLSGFCPLFSFLGINSCKIKK